MISSKTFTRFAILAAVLLTSGISALAGDAGAQASPAPEKKPEFKRPPYNPVSRWKEDWSGLRGRDRNNTGDAAKRGRPAAQAIHDDLATRYPGRPAKPQPSKP